MIKLLDLTPKKTFGANKGKEVYQKLINSHKLNGLEVPERFHEIGSEEGIEKTENYIGEKYGIY